MVTLSLHPAKAQRTTVRAALLAALLIVLCSFHVSPCSADECADLACYTTVQQANTRLFLQLLGTALSQDTWTGDDFCAWAGLTCNAAGVKVFLGSSGVVGTLPELSDDIDGAEVQVFRLDLSNSPAITGTLPVSWGGLTQLSEFVVSGTSLTGTVPAAYSGMTALTDFLIFATQVTGTLPEAWAGLPSLQHFAAQATQITGTIPAAWSAAPLLEHFLMHETQIDGPLPSTWGNLTKMELFAVLHTNVSGTLPPEWGNWSKVQAVRIDDTQIAGTLPPEWSGMTTIVEFSATNTQLTGTIPDAWGAMSNLKSVTLPDTDVTCCLPYQWLCSQELTTDGVGLTSTASSTCPTKEEVCGQPESSYTSSCPAYTTTTTTSLPSSENSGGSSSSKFPWWAILLIVLLVVALVIAAGVVVWCCCGCGGGCTCCPQRKSLPDEAEAEDIHNNSSYAPETELHERAESEDLDERISTGSVVEAAPSMASVRTQPVTKLNPFVFQESFTGSSGNAVEAAAASAQCKKATEEDCVVPFDK